MLYITRHGKTSWNIMNKLQGRTDIPLSEEGRQMAIAASEEYKDVNIDVCFSSPLLRARETAELMLAGRNIPIIFDDRLMEMSFGDYEGIENSFDDPDCPINVIFKEPQNYTESIGGSETFEELFARTGQFLEELVLPRVEAGEDVLIVGHGAMNLSIISRIRDLPREDYWSPGLEQCKMMRLI